jgi:hypothetical protein
MLKLYMLIISDKVRHKATLDIPPPELKLMDAAPRQKSAKYTPQTNDAVPQWALPMMALFGMANGRSPVRKTVPSYEDRERRHSHSRSPITPRHKRSATLSAPVEDIDIGTWLTGLDSDPIRGRKGLNYQQYTAAFEAKGVLELSDLHDLGAETLMQTFEMNIGMAKRLDRFAKEDRAASQAVKRPHLSCTT